MNGTASTQRDTQSAGADASGIEAVLQAMKEAHGEGPGRFLKQLREAMGLSESEAASRLSMNVVQVRALELNDFDRLPAPIFVRSFLQRYAGLVGLPKDQVQQAYDRLGVNQLPGLARVSPPRELRAEAKPMPKKWVGYAVGGVMVVVLAWIISTIDFSATTGETPASAVAPPSAQAPVAAPTAVLPSVTGTELALPPPPQAADPALLEPVGQAKPAVTR